MFELLVNRFNDYLDNYAVISGDLKYTYKQLFDNISALKKNFEKKGVNNNSVVIIIGNFSFTSISSLIAIILCKATVIPLTVVAYDKLRNYTNLLNPDFIVDQFGEICRAQESFVANKFNWSSFNKKESGNLVVFTSGSTGTPKAIIHNVDALCSRYSDKKKSLSSLCFLQFDHMGGINTILSILFRGGICVDAMDRQVINVCNLIQNHKIELLPTTPSFLAQLLISNAWRKNDLSSLKVISYGTEVMNEVILNRLLTVFPNCIFKQTYGLSETGVLQIHSESSGSLWFKFVEKELEYKILEDLLWLKTRSNLAGKIIFESHRTFLELNNQEWFCTNDLVSVKGEFIKILGRKSEIINVAGLKVYPSEVENCIFELDFIDDVVVLGKNQPLLGQMVVAYLKLKEDYAESKIASEKIIKNHCIKRLEKFKVPSKFVFDDNNFIGDRFKKNRLLLDN